MAQERGAGRAKPAAEVPEEYRAIFEAVADGVPITDPATGRIVAVTPRCAGCYVVDVQHVAGETDVSETPAVSGA
jgi:hypothetical protein